MLSVKKPCYTKYVVILIMLFIDFKLEWYLDSKKQNI